MLDKKAVQEILDSARERFHCMGISLTLTEDGMHHSFNSGYADAERGRPMTEETILPIGSSSKAFTAAAICMLDDCGALKLDEPVKTYLPEFQMYDKYTEAHLTVRDLLCHRCGLPRHDFLWYAYEGYTDAQLVEALAHLKPFTSLRENYHYNNLMFATAGHLIQRVSGKSWDVFVAEKIAAPLGAERVSFCVEELKREPLAAIGYGYDEKSASQKILPYKQISGIGAAGSINASTAQMVKWIDLQLNGGRVGEVQVISEKNLQECHRPQTLMGKQPVSLPGNDFESYGLGWMMQRCKGRKLVHHGGNIDGFSAMHFFLPEEKLGASILSNTGENSARSAVMYALVDLLLGEDWRIGMEQLDTLVAQQRALLLQPTNARHAQPKLPQTLENEQLCGSYCHPGYGKLTVRETAGTLIAAIGSLTLELAHISQNVFELRAKAGENFPLQFVQNFNGQVIACEADFEPMIGEPIRFTKQGVSYV